MRKLRKLIYNNRDKGNSFIFWLIASYLLFLEHNNGLFLIDLFFLLSMFFRKK